MPLSNTKLVKRNSKEAKLKRLSLIFSGKPLASDNPTPAWTPDSERRVEPPFLLKTWLDGNMFRIRNSGSVQLFDGLSYQSDVKILGQGSGSRTLKSNGAETFLWQVRIHFLKTLSGFHMNMFQVRGTSTVNIAGKVYNLTLDDTLLVPEDSSFEFGTSDQDCAVLSTLMNPKNKSRIATEA